MSDKPTSAELAPIASPTEVVPARAPEKAFDRMIAKLERKYSRTLVGAAHWPYPDHVIDRLPEDMRRAAYAARMNKKDAPIGLQMAQEYLSVKARMDSIKNQKGLLSISIGGNAVIQLPDRLPPPLESEVVVLNPDDARNED